MRPQRHKERVARIDVRRESPEPIRDALVFGGFELIGGFARACGLAVFFVLFFCAVAPFLKIAVIASQSPKASALRGVDPPRQVVDAASPFPTNGLPAETALRPQRAPHLLRAIGVVRQSTCAPCNASLLLVSMLSIFLSFLSSANLADGRPNLKNPFFRQLVSSAAVDVARNCPLHLAFSPSLSSLAY